VSPGHLPAGRASFFEGAIQQRAAIWKYSNLRLYRAGFDGTFSTLFKSILSAGTNNAHWFVRMKIISERLLLSI
jgi:hypothetical protein